MHEAQSLLTSIFPKDEMERMAGGSYNRVVGGILRHNSADPMPVILRIPRDDYLQPGDEVAVLRYLTEMTNIPVSALTLLLKRHLQPLYGTQSPKWPIPGACVRLSRRRNE